MTTVVLTPKYIASDHCFIHQSFPTETRVDLNYKKIFINPSKTIIIGTSGEYFPDQIDSPRSWEIIHDIFCYIMAGLADFGLIEDGLSLSEHELPMDEYGNIFDKGGHTFIVSKKYRFVISYSKLFKQWSARTVGDHAGSGSGGAIATGLLIGGMKISDIWEPLHRLDHLSSQEHTIIPLSMLKNMPKMDRQLRAIRQETREKIFERKSS